MTKAIYMKKHKKIVGMRYYKTSGKRKSNDMLLVCVFTLMSRRWEMFRYCTNII